MTEVEAHVTTYSLPLQIINGRLPTGSTISSQRWLRLLSVSHAYWTALTNNNNWADDLVHAYVATLTVAISGVSTCSLQILCQTCLLLAQARPHNVLLELWSNLVEEIQFLGLSPNKSLGSVLITCEVLQGLCSALIRPCSYQDKVLLADRRLLADQHPGEAYGNLVLQATLLGEGSLPYGGRGV